MVKNLVNLQKQDLNQKLQNTYISRAVNLTNTNSDLIKVIIGPRRAGKSYFGIHLLKQYPDYGYLNFDDDRLIGVSDSEDYLVSINEVYSNPKTILFDEIQNVPKWELFVNRLQRRGYNLILTGSNANLLSSELATHLTGRHVKIYLFPLSYREIVDSQNKDLTSYNKKEILNTYLVNGGYPEPFVKELNYKTYLSDLINATIYKDIVKRYKIRYPQKIFDLAVYLISNVCSEFTCNSLSKLTNIKDSKTIDKYLSYLKESLLLFSVPRFSYKIKEQISGNKKIYCIDNGIISNLSFKFSPDFGKLYENLIAIELKKRELSGDISFYFWKNIQNEEVDFVVKENLKVKQLIQVCYDLSNKKTEDREIRALLKASNDLKCDNLLIITSNLELEKEHTWYGITRKIKYISLLNWLLEK